MTAAKKTKMPPPTYAVTYAAARAMLAVLKGIASLAVAYENDPKEMTFQISLAATKAIAQAEAAGIK